MATVTKTFAFLSNSESFVATAGPASTLSWDGSTGNPAGALKSVIAGRNKTDTNFWELTTTWEALGVPTGSIVSAVRVNAAYTRCTAYVTGATSTIGPYELYDGTPTLQATLWAGRSISGTDATWVAVAAQADQSVPSGIQPSNSTIRIRLNDTLHTGANNSATVTTYDDQVSLVITYSTPIASSASYAARITGQNVDNLTLDAFITGADVPAQGQASWMEIQIPLLGTNVSQSYDARLTGRLTSSQAWDVRLTAFNANALASDVRVTAQATTLAAYDARVTGRNTSSLATDARITGQTSNSVTYDARLTAQTTNSITYDARTTGQLGSNRTQDARLVSPTTTSAAYDARLVSSSTNSVSQDSRITAQTSSLVAYDARLTSRSTSFVAFDVRATGVAATATTTQDIRSTGTATDSRTLDGKITGQSSSVVSYAARLIAQLSNSVAYDARVTGKIAGGTSQEIVANTTGQATSSSAFDIREVGSALNNITYDTRITGQTSNSKTYDARLTAQTSNSVTQDIRLTGSSINATSYDIRVTGNISGGATQDIDARITGQLTSLQAYNTRLTAQLASAQSYDARVTGNITGSAVQENTAQLTGQNTSSTSYSTRLTGSTVNSSAFSARATGQASTNSAYASRVTAQSSAITTFDVCLTSGIAIGLSYDVRLTATSPTASLSTDARITGTSSGFQIARPNGDVTPGLWTSVPSGTLASVLDETIANDADYIISSTGPTTADVAEVSLAPINDPLVYDQHTISYRYRAGTVGGMPIQLTVRLMQGSTMIASWVHTGIQSTTVINATQTLTVAQAQSITNYSDLRLRFEACQLSTPFIIAAHAGQRGAGSKSLSVTQVISPTSNATVNNTLVLVIVNQSPTGTVAGFVNDTKGNTWTVDHMNTSAPGISICSTRQDQGALTTLDTITVQMGSSSAISYWLEEFVGQFTKDTSNIASGSNGTTFTTGTVTTTTPTEFAISAFAAQKNGGTVSWSWTLDPNSNSFPTGSLPTANSVISTNAQYRILTSLSTFNVSDTVSSNANAGWNTSIITYKAVGS